MKWSKWIQIRKEGTTKKEKCMRRMNIIPEKVFSDKTPNGASE
jgi:hypothetical protein